MRMIAILLVGAACGAVDGAGNGDAGNDGVADGAPAADGAPGADGAGADDAPGADGAVAPPPDCATLPPVGWQRRVTTSNLAQAAPTVFEEVHWLNPSDARWTPFPYGGSAGKIATDHGEYISLQFTTPTDIVDWDSRAPLKSAYWIASPVDGEATLSSVYVTFSRCAGDFRVPTAGSTAPSNDPTFAPGCTSRRPFPGSPNTAPRTDVYYKIGTGPSTAEDCMLAPGETYHLNFIRADVSGGSVRSPAAEIDPGYASNCDTAIGDRTFCGVAMRVE